MKNQFGNKVGLGVKRKKGEKDFIKLYNFKSKYLWAVRSNFDTNPWPRQSHNTFKEKRRMKDATVKKLLVNEGKFEIL